MLGSSPLTRGKRPVPGLQGRHPGLIPAHAGKTVPASISGQRPWAHPRSRGENEAAIQSGADTAGSSPLTRGKHPVQGDRARPRGLIPAHAGKTPIPKGTHHAYRAHPRSRGENRSDVRRWIDHTGSSPLTRGKLFVGIPGFLTLGLIPAHAGKTRGTGASRPGAEAHPRSRGENGLGERGRVQRVGSSPLTRGKPE